MQIKDVMSQNCDWVAPETTLSEAATMMQKNDVGFLPVGENDRLIGTITDRDIVLRCVAQGNNPSDQTVRETMTEKLLYCFDDQTAEEICMNMAEIKVRRLPVVNRDKRLVGLVSLGDLAQSTTEQSGVALKEITSQQQQNVQAA